MKRSKAIITSVFMAIIIFASASINSNNLFAQDTGIVTVQSKTSYVETVAAAKKMIAKNGMMVLSEINQGKILGMTGLSVKNVSLFVGNPQIGKKLFSQNKGIGIAVPARLNIYEDNDGKTYINYVKPSFQMKNFQNEKIQKIGMMLDKKLGMLTTMLSK